MSEELDPNKLVVEFINANFDRIAQPILSGIKGTKAIFRSRLKTTYSAYLERILERHSKSKSFFVRSEVPISSFFVPPNLSNRQHQLSAPTAASLAAVAPATIVTGLGGCGKTMLMRHFLVSSILEQTKTPVLVELRQLNNSDNSLQDTVLQTLEANGLDVDQKYMELAFKAGHFCLLLDGFDELLNQLREPLIQQIQRFHETYPKNWIFVSSRPDKKLEGLVGFSSFSVDPLDLDQAVDLVQRLPFDDPVKGRFIDSLNNGLYEKHVSFLSNPLLLSIMLLTFGDTAHIPDKLSIFYQQAYDSLFQKHDALKGGFQRDRRTKLDIQDFAKVFSAFCVQAYDKRQFSFTYSQALQYFDKARNISGLEFESEEVLQDSMQAVCLMIEDGLEIGFVHRSFQEFFVAKFISSSPPDTKGKLIERFSQSGEVDVDAVLQLLFEMDPYAVEEHYLLPSIEKIKTLVKFKRTVGVTHSLRYLKIMFERFEIIRVSNETSPSLGAVIKNFYLFNAVTFAHRAYPRTEDDSNDSKKIRESIVEVFQEEYGEEGTVSLSSLRTTHRFFHSLIKSTNFWGISNLQQIIDIGALIEKRHKKSLSSLDAILSDPRHRQL